MIAITGANGQLGRLVIDYLRQNGVDGEQIRGLVRSVEACSDLGDAGVLLSEGHYDDRQSLVRAFEGADTLLFISNADVTQRQRQHSNVVAAAQDAGVPWVVYTSFTDIGTDNPLRATHAQTEADIFDSGMDWTILRNNLYMDLFVGKILGAMQTGVYRSPHGADIGAALGTRDDMARATAAVLTGGDHRGRIYAFTGPETVLPGTIAAAASDLSGRPVRTEQITWDELAADLQAIGMPEDAVNMALAVERWIGTNALAEVSPDMETLSGEPSTTIAQLAAAALAAQAAGEPANG